MVSYKRNAGEGNPKASRHFEINKWIEVINVFVLRIQCLFGVDRMDFSDLRNNIHIMRILYRK